MAYFAEFRGWICTANKDGSIPLSSKLVIEINENDKSTYSAGLMRQLIQQANAWQEYCDTDQPVRPR